MGKLKIHEIWWRQTICRKNKGVPRHGENDGGSKSLVLHYRYYVIINEQSLCGKYLDMS